MRRVLLAERAMFFKFDACRVQLLVFGHRIIAALAVATFERDNFSHYILTCSLKDQTQPLCFCLLLLPSSGRSSLSGTTNPVRGMTLPPASQSRTTILRLYPGAGDGTRTLQAQPATNPVRGMTLPPASQSRTTILRLYPGAGDGTRTRDQQLGRL